jgi:hypothetical protein
VISDADFPSERLFFVYLSLLWFHEANPAAGERGYARIKPYLNSLETDKKRRGDAKGIREEDD